MFIMIIISICYKIIPQVVDGGVIEIDFFQEWIRKPREKNRYQFL